MSTYINSSLTPLAKSSDTPVLNLLNKAPTWPSLLITLSPAPFLYSCAFVLIAPPPVPRFKPCIIIRSPACIKWLVSVVTVNSWPLSDKPAIRILPPGTLLLSSFSGTLLNRNHPNLWLSFEVVFASASICWSDAPIRTSQSADGSLSKTIVCVDDPFVFVCTLDAANACTNPSFVSE